MKAEYDNTNRISVFKNDKGDNPKRPDYTGSLNVEGSDYYVSIWIRESKEGKKYMSGEVKLKDESQSKFNNQSTDTKSVDFDDDVPF